MSDKQGFFEILGKARAVLSRPDRRRGGILLFLTLLETLSDVMGLALIPPLVYLVSDLSLVQQHPRLARLQSGLGIEDVHNFVLVLVAALLTTFILRHAFGIWVLRRQHEFAASVALNLSLRRFRAFVSMDYEAQKRIPSSVATRDIAIIPSEFAASVLLPCGVIVTEGLVLGWILLGIFLLDFRVMLLMGLVITPPLLISRRLIRGRAARLGDLRINSRTEGYRILSQAIFGFAYLRLFGRAEHFVTRSLAAFREFYRADTQVSVLSHIPRRLVELSAVSGIGALIAYTMVVPSREADLVPLLALVAAAAYRVMPSMTRLLMALTTLKSATHVFDLLGTELDDLATLEDDAPAEGLPLRNQLAFQEVSFAYGSEQGFALQQVSFHVLRGERVGFVGPSGSGKTTLMNLVLRFIREQAGEILVDGSKLLPRDDQRWQKTLGFVQQDPYLLDGSLAENVAFGEGAAELDRSRVSASLKAASLQPLVDSLPAGIDSPVGEFGGTLSGGQRQRIAIARALYRNAEVLVLDEATSALDAQTEREVTKTLLDLSEESGKTVLLIAHRGSLLNICDRVYRLERGRVVEELEGAALDRWRRAKELPTGTEERATE